MDAKVGICEHCGAVLSMDEIIGDSHARAVADKNGEPIPDQCGPVTRYVIASALSAQAARIKELEEALGLCLPHVQTDCWRYCEPKATVTVEKSKSGRTWDLVEPIARTKAKAALDGVRKVGCVYDAKRTY